MKKHILFVAGIIAGIGFQTTQPATPTKEVLLVGFTTQLTKLKLEVADLKKKMPRGSNFAIKPIKAAFEAQIKARESKIARLEFFVAILKAPTPKLTAKLKYQIKILEAQIEKAEQDRAKIKGPHFVTKPIKAAHTAVIKAKKAEIAPYKKVEKALGL